MSDERRRESSDVYSNARLINLLSMLYHCITTARRRGEGEGAELKLSRNSRIHQDFITVLYCKYTVGTVQYTVQYSNTVQY